MGETLLEVRGLAYDYEGVSALDGVDLPIGKGENLALLGANGSGKSTLFLHLNGSLRAKSGELYLSGKRIGASKDELTELRRRVGLVFQNPDDQLFAATVRQDISFGPLNLGMDESRVREVVEEAMAALNITDLADRPTHQLSFGQKKRVVLAGIIAMSPDILLLDEPTAGLDSRSTAELLEILDSLKARGATLVVATHDVDFAWSWADTAAILDKGRVIACGGLQEVFSGDTAKKSGLTYPHLLMVYRLLTEKKLLQDFSGPPCRMEDFFELLNGGGGA